MLKEFIEESKDTSYRLFKDICEKLNKNLLKIFGRDVINTVVNPYDTEQSAADPTVLERIRNPIWNVDVYKYLDKFTVLFEQVFILGLVLRRLLQEAGLYDKDDKTTYCYLKDIRIWRLEKDYWVELSKYINSIPLHPEPVERCDLDYITNTIKKLNEIDGWFYHGPERRGKEAIKKLEEYRQIKQEFEARIFKQLPYLAKGIAKSVENIVNEIMSRPLIILVNKLNWYTRYGISVFVDEYSKRLKNLKDLRRVYLLMVEEDSVFGDGDQYFVSIIEQENGIKGEFGRRLLDSNTENAMFSEIAECKFIENNATAIFRKLLTDKPFVFGSDDAIYVFSNRTLKRTELVSINDIAQTQ